MARVTLMEVAGHLDMSEGNASTMCRALKIDRDNDSVDDIRVAYIKDLREKAAGRGGDGQADLIRARIRESLATAKIKELQFLEACGGLIAVEDIQPLLENWVTVARSEVSNALNKIIGDIQGKFKIEIDPCIVDKHIVDAYKIIGTYPGRDSGADRGNSEVGSDTSGLEVDPP